MLRVLLDEILFGEDELWLSFHPFSIIVNSYFQPTNEPTYRP